MKVLQNTSKNRKYLESLPSIYLVGFWANYGMLKFPFSGKYVKREVFKKDDFIDVPMVWYYNDHNGAEDQFELVPLDWVTTGQIIVWTQSEERAEKVVKALRKENKKEIQFS